jgi:hypothetical protein
MLLARFDLDLALRHMNLFIEDRDDLGDVFVDEELRQGFAWRPTSLTFFVFEECEITSHVEAEFCLDDRERPSTRAERVIKVPFTLPPSDRLIVMDVRDSGSEYLDLPPGDYCVTVELGHSGNGAAPSVAVPDCCELWARFTFVPGTCEAEIVRADPELKPPPKLIIGKA